MDFGRLITAMVTPFDEQLRVNWTQAEKLIDFLIDEQQSESLVVCGTTGESPTTTDEEKLELFRLAVSRARGRCKIIAGTGTYDTAHSVKLSKEAEKIGVDGLLLVSPYYNRPSQEGLYEHFKQIADSVSLPVMLYNIPKRTGVNIEPDTLIRLSQIPNIVASKEAHSDLDHVTEIIENTAGDFKIYSGDDNLTLPMMSIGGYGIVSVASNVIGKEIRQMIDHFLAGDAVKAAEQHRRLFPMFKGLFVCPNPVLVKYALNVSGMNVGGVRPPLVEAGEAEKEMIRNLLGKLQANPLGA